MPARWADVMDDEDDNPNDYGKGQSNVIILPTAPKSIRGPDIDISKVPQQPPFICYLSNLPFEVSEDDIHKFFKELKITRVDLSKDPSASNRTRGQGTCEFQDRQSLIDAFTFNKETIRNRPISLSIHSFEQERENRYRERDNDKEDRTAGDWRARPDKPNSNSNFQSNNRSFQEENSSSNNFSNYRNNYRDRNQNYGGSDSYDNNQRNTYNNRNQYNNRNYNNYNNNNQNNDYQPQQNQQNPEPHQPAQRGSADHLRDYLSKTLEPVEAPRERPRLQLNKPTRPRPELNVADQQPASQQQHLPPPQQRSESESSESARKSLEPEKPVERKRLILAPRKKESVESAQEETSASKSSIFGDAKPVDTSKRLQEIELKKKQEEAIIEEKLKELEGQDKKELNTSGNREYNKRLSDSGSHGSSQQNLDMGNNRSNYRDNPQHSHDSNSRDHRGPRGGQNRFRDNDDGYRKQGGNRRNLNNGNRNYDNKNNYQNNNYNRENQRDNYNRNKYDNNQQNNNNWSNNNDNQMMNRKPDYEDRAQNTRYGGGANRMSNRDRNEGSYQNRNRFDVLNDEME